MSGVVVVVDEGQTVFKGVVAAGAVEAVFYGVAEYLFAAFFADRALYVGEFGETGGADEGAFWKDDLVADGASRTVCRMRVMD